MEVPDRAALGDEAAEGSISDDKKDNAQHVPLNTSRTMRILQSASLLHKSSVLSVQFSSKGNLLAVLTNDTLVLWDLDEVIGWTALLAIETREIHCDGALAALAFSHDSSAVFVGGSVRERARRRGAVGESGSPACVRVPLAVPDAPARLPFPVSWTDCRVANLVALPYGALLSMLNNGCVVAWKLPPTANLSQVATAPCAVQRVRTADHICKHTSISVVSHDAEESPSGKTFFQVLILAACDRSMELLRVTFRARDIEITALAAYTMGECVVPGQDATAISKIVALPPSSSWFAEPVKKHVSSIRGRLPVLAHCEVAAAGTVERDRQDVEPCGETIFAAAVLSLETNGSASGAEHTQGSSRTVLNLSQGVRRSSRRGKSDWRPPVAEATKLAVVAVGGARVDVVLPVECAGVVQCCICIDDMLVLGCTNGDLVTMSATSGAVVTTTAHSRGYPVFCMDKKHTGDGEVAVAAGSEDGVVSVHTLSFAK